MKKKVFCGFALAAATLITGPPLRAQQPSTERPAQATQTGAQPRNADVVKRLKAHEPSAKISGARPVHLAIVTSTSRISAMPEAYYGIPVSVHANVARIDSPHVFTLENGWWQWGSNLAVLVPAPRGGAALDDTDYVTVVGTVRPFVQTEFERDYDWFDAIPDLTVEFEGRPVIVAEFARTSDGAVLTQPGRQVTPVLVASPGQIADLPGRFYGSVVSVSSEVEDVRSSRIFTLDEDEWFAGPDVLVFNPFPVATHAVAEDTHVRVLGTVRPFILSEFETDYDWFDAADYDRLELQGLERRPVIVASSVHAADGREFVEFRPDLTLWEAELDLAPRVAQWSQMAERDRDRQPRGERGTAGQQ
jgi:hypothetical protein